MLNLGVSAIDRSIHELLSSSMSLSLACTFIFRSYSIFPAITTCAVALPAIKNRTVSNTAIFFISKVIDRFSLLHRIQGYV